MTKGESLYQVKLIIDNLPDEEYNLIPEDTIRYIDDNMEYSENVKINPDIPLEEQEIDEKTYDFLDKMIYKIDYQSSNIRDNTSKESIYELSNEEMIKLIEKYKEENSKLPKAKKLVEEYKNFLEQKDKEISELKVINQDLYSSIHNCPRLVRKLFFKKFEKQLLK